ncbi:hypothetical protein AB9F39_37265, partial [Rhizobium leguminosarum]|uniref:hypothetical protein n=1 Tax=Rhizobium leguminosarum TaxID=384 RepID=UPI003F99F4EB
VAATYLATALMGDAIAANMFLLGHAWHRGLVPSNLAAIDKAIELNGTGIAMNRAAFGLGFGLDETGLTGHGLDIHRSETAPAEG